MDVSGVLERLMVHNPNLRVHVDYGYHNGATPHFDAEYVFAHMNLDEVARVRITHRYHEAGHMMYLKPEARLAQLEALKQFVQGS